MDSIRASLRKVRRKLRHHGVARTAYAVLLKVLGHQRWLSVLRCHYLEVVDPAFLEPPPRYVGSFFSPRAIAEFTRDPEASMAEEFAAYALAKGDKCYGFLHEGALRAYGWYAATPTRVTRDLRLNFSRDYVYMYKAFTHESHRGKRLFPFGVMRALQHYRAAGYKGMLLYVDANNLDSLKSCARMGFRAFGTVFIATILGRQLVCASPGCARFGMRIEDTSGEAQISRTFGPKLMG
jgi:acetyltransferase (GNAT) family protein